MRGFKLKWLLSIDIIVLLLGIIVILMSIILSSPENSSGSTILNAAESLGTALVAAGIVNVLIRTFYLKPDPKKINILAFERRNISKEYHNKKYESAEIDIVGNVLYSCIKDFVKEEKRIISRVLHNDARVRLMFISPEAPYVQQRAKVKGDETPEELKEKLQKSVLRCVRFYNTLCKEYKRNESEDGMFCVNLMNWSPNLTISRYDDTIYWGIYTSNTRGRRNPLFDIPKEDIKIRRQLTEHFDKLWKESDDNWLIKYNTQQLPRINKELLREVFETTTLNKSIMKEILGELFEEDKELMEILGLSEEEMKETAV